MKKILRKHLLAVLGLLVLVFIAIIIGFYIWGIGYIVTTVNEANNRQVSGGQVPQFNLDAAGKLDYRGTLQQ